MDIRFAKAIIGDILEKRYDIQSERMLNIYSYGSRVYGVQKENSDYDFIIVIDDDGLRDYCFEHKEIFKDGNGEYLSIDFNVYGEREFRERVRNYDISALECLCISEFETLIKHIGNIDNDIKYSDICYIVKDIKYSDYFNYSSENYGLDLFKLRSLISEKASHSWVRAKKKFVVCKDRNIYSGKKSLWHSLRILSFGIQIAKYGYIKNIRTPIMEMYHNLLFCDKLDFCVESYSKIDFFKEHIKLFVGFDNKSEDWSHYDKYFRKIYNELTTEFRKYAPKC